MSTTATPLPPECDKVILTAEQISLKVGELGQRISEDLHGREAVLVTVLRGGLFFLADLCRKIDLPDVRIDFMAVSQYSPGSGGAVRVTKDLTDDIAGADVILVEDVVDTGLTVNYVHSLLTSRGPASLRICTLLDKPVRRIADVPIDYTGFELPDHFVVGYGLDLRGRYRGLPYIASLRDEMVM